jgi:hypothetical protein
MAKPVRVTIRHFYDGEAMTKQESQSEKFKDAARKLGCDDDPAHFRDRLGKLVKHKPVEKPE